jgi:hypothetical protein
MRAAVWIATLLLAVAPAWPRTARAEQATTSERAVELGHEGLKLFEAGRWAEALERFTQANAAAFSPVFLLYVARCQRELGHLREALRTLESLPSEPPSDAPPTWHNALGDAARERDDLRQRVPALRITGPGVKTATVDGQAAALDQLVRVDPGEHVVRAWSGDGRLVLRRVVLSEGQPDALVEVSFASPTAKPVEPPARSLPPTPKDAVPTAEPRWRTGFWITGGAAVASAVVGTVAGLWAKAETDSIRERCDADVCRPELEREAESARTKANISTAAFAVGGVSLAASVTFLLLD